MGSSGWREREEEKSWVRIRGRGRKEREGEDIELLESGRQRVIEGSIISFSLVIQPAET